MAVMQPAIALGLGALLSMPLSLACTPSIERLIRNEEYNDAMRAAAFGRGAAAELEHDREVVAASVARALRPSVTVHVVSRAALLGSDPDLVVPRALDEDVVVLSVDHDSHHRSLGPSVELEVWAGDRQLELLPFTEQRAAHLTGELERLERLSGSRQMKRGRTLLEGIFNAVDWMTGGGQWVPPSHESGRLAAPHAYALVNALGRRASDSDESSRLVLVMMRPRETSRLDMRIRLTTSAVSTYHDRLRREVDEGLHARGLPHDALARLRWEVRRTLDLEAPRPSIAVDVLDDAIPAQWVEPTRATGTRPSPPAETVLIGRAGLRGTLYCSRFTARPALEPRRITIGQVPVEVSEWGWSQKVHPGAIVVAVGTPIPASEPEPLLRWDLAECAPGTNLAGREVVAFGHELVPAQVPMPEAFDVRSFDWTTTRVGPGLPRRAGGLAVRSPRIAGRAALAPPVRRPERRRPARPWEGDTILVAHGRHRGPGCARGRSGELPSRAEGLLHERQERDRGGHLRVRQRPAGHWATWLRAHRSDRQDRPADGAGRDR
ncbi:hypothetical protein [Paraliomyxa miuraensis]|uniref:hypothetical protein n=1 Tax=Paraliomyxa miuraensis TaxID=376150 RepID=UPI00225A3D94|nr:hypothetical protein [Paraliomyxa miuraensis]MCX4240761.1 hypothetical protein [Paraliomyxa miuraensis]